MTSRLSPRARLTRIRFAVAVHVIAIAATIGVLGPGNLVDDALARRSFVAHAPWAWPIVWGGWALATLSLLLVFAAWADTLESRWWRWTALALAFLGGAIDWTAEAVWIWWAPGWAARAGQLSGDDLYACWNRVYQVASFGVANLLYCAAGLVLSAGSWRTAAFPRWLARTSGLVWAFSLVISAVGFAGRPSWIPVVAAFAFLLFLPWLVLLGHGWLRATDPQASEAAMRASSLGTTLCALAPKHPIRMRTVFRDCVLVNFAIDPAVMRGLLPAPIEPAIHDGAAYLSIVIARMDRMRPVFVPHRLGITYDQVVYRVVVRHRGAPGVFFLRSDANNRLMCLAGNALTFFRFHHADIEYRADGGILHVDVRPPPDHHADIRASYDLGGSTDTMPRTSRFQSLAQAQGFLVELYTAFGHDPLTGAVSAIGIERGHWEIQVVNDRRAGYRFMDGSARFPAGSARLDSIFYIEQVPYLWHALQRR